MSKVSVLIATYLPEAQRYLDASLRSLKAQTFQDFETILVSSGDYLPKASVDIHHHSATRLHFPAAISKAYELSCRDSEYCLLLNDDCIMSKTCLEELVGTMASAPVEMILGPRSNCGPIMGFYHTLSGFVLNGQPITLGPQFRYQDVEPYIDNLIENPIPYPSALVKIPFSPFFCTLIRRSTYEKVGRIDPNFKTGSDDSDFAKRAADLGIGCYVAFHASVAHASGVSADLSLTDEDRAFNHKLFAEKHKSI